MVGAEEKVRGLSDDAVERFHGQAIQPQVGQAHGGTPGNENIGHHGMGPCGADQRDRFAAAAPSEMRGPEGVGKLGEAAIVETDPVEIEGIMCRCHETAHRVIGRTDTGRDPEGAAELLCSQIAALLPPDVPQRTDEPARVDRPSGIGPRRHESGQSEQHGIRLGRRTGQRTQPCDGHQDRQSPEGILVVLIAESGHQFFPEQLFRFATLQGKNKTLRLGPQPFLSGALQPADLGVGIHLLQRMRSQRQRVGIGREVDVLKRKARIRSQRFLQGDLQQPGNFHALIIDQMETDIPVARILRMAVLFPGTCMDMDLQITADAPLPASDAQHGVQEIGACLEIPVAGILHLDALTVSSLQPFRPMARIGPEALKMALPVGEGVEGGGRFHQCRFRCMRAIGFRVGETAVKGRRIFKHMKRIV